MLKNNMRVILAKQRKKTSDVAEATGISKSTLTALYYERAKNPSLDTLKKVSSYLGVTLDEFLDTKE
ncbi:helix-turn-helix protein [Streptococcus mitis]|uniref:Helix-turn-helix protein n=1 Tax=Streptococcus mitis TaxID=28037 RepID=A0A0F2D8Z1_STRMT|nr:helix-turn-helix protein [Streptococcus mitis]